MKPSKSISPARQLAFTILRRVATEQAFAANLLAAETVNQLNPPDRHLVHELVLGVLRWQLQLDYLIEQYARRPVGKLDAAVVIALRLGLYQLRFLSRIPASAAVNESVELVKRNGYRSAASLANAVLRRAASEQDQPVRITATDELARLAILHSHPQWLLESWQQQFGLETTVQLAAANNQIPPVAFRCNLLKLQPAELESLLAERGIEVAPSPLVAGAYRLSSGAAAALQDLRARGLIYFQDEGSQLVGHLVAAQKGERVLDLCAAPGSKTTQLATAMNNTGLIVAGDLHGHRLLTLRESCARLGVTNIAPMVFDASASLPLAESLQFDRVLVDAPCTGTGTLRHNPEIKWRLQPEQITALSRLQGQLLRTAARRVKPGGRLVYSTCSLEREENEAVVQDFLREYAEFELLRPELSLLTAEGFVRTMPQAQNTDGFFAAVLRRTH